MGHFPIHPVNSELQLLPKEHNQMKKIYSNLFLMHAVCHRSGPSRVPWQSGRLWTQLRDSHEHLSGQSSFSGKKIYELIIFLVPLWTYLKSIFLDYWHVYWQKLSWCVYLNWMQSGTAMYAGLFSRWQGIEVAMVVSFHSHSVLLKWFFKKDQY